jgi:ribosome-associated toxin RatA of RatAB toxin-antitoxin module
MKDISGSASAQVPVSARRCFELLIAVEDYPSWIGDYVREVHVLERDGRGRPARARAVVHVAQSPFGKDFTVDVTVSPESARRIRVSRIPAGPEDEDRLELIWHVEPGAGATVAVEFAAQVSAVPGWLPVGDAGDAIARAALQAAADALEERFFPTRQQA